MPAELPFVQPFFVDLIPARPGGKTIEMAGHAGNAVVFGVMFMAKNDRGDIRRREDDVALRAERAGPCKCCDESGENASTCAHTEGPPWIVASG